MEKSLEIKVDKNLTTEENVKNLILTEVKLGKALKQIKKISGIYKDEFNEYRKNLHITKGGDVMFIPDMKDDHLINTVKFFVKAGYSLGSNGVKKYISEIKKRNLVSEILNSQEFENLDMPVISKGRYNSYKNFEFEDDDNEDYSNNYEF